MVVDVHPPLIAYQLSARRSTPAAWWPLNRI